jgi:BMFP domain-containing protein YqiC
MPQRKRLEPNAVPYYITLNTRRVSMSQGPNRMFDEFAKLMTDAAGAAQGLRREGEEFFRAQADRVMANMDVVKREEFEVVRDMAIKALEENEALKARIAALEGEVPKAARAKKV